jgi:hypothetical protein
MYLLPMGNNRMLHKWLLKRPSAKKYLKQSMEGTMTHSAADVHDDDDDDDDDNDNIWSQLYLNKH